MTKKLRFVTVAVAIFFCMNSFAGDGKLRVMSYNLRFGELASMTDIGSYIKSLDADIVALQECDWDTHRERAPKQNGVKFTVTISADEDTATEHAGLLRYGETRVAFIPKDQPPAPPPVKRLKFPLILK